MSRTVTADELLSSGAQLLDQVAMSGETIVITKHGEPIATLAPFVQRVASPFGCMQGTIAVSDPADTLLSAIDDTELAAWEQGLLAKLDRVRGQAAGPQIK